MRCLALGNILMFGATKYSIVEHLRDGRSIEVRSLRPSDKELMLAAVGRTSSQSIQRRFFGPKKHFSEQEIAFFLNIDFEDHVALVAQIDEDEGAAIVGYNMMKKKEIVTVSPSPSV